MVSLSLSPDHITRDTYVRHVMSSNAALYTYSALDTPTPLPRARIGFGFITR